MNTKDNKELIKAWRQMYEHITDFKTGSYRCRFSTENKESRLKIKQYILDQIDEEIKFIEENEPVASGCNSCAGCKHNCKGE